MSKENNKEQTFKGIPGSPGVATGPVQVHTATELPVPIYRIPPERREAEHQRFLDAVLETQNQIDELRRRISQHIGQDEAYIFDSHMLLVGDKPILEGTERLIKEKGYNAEFSFQTTITDMVDAFSSVEDDYIKERAADIQDVSRRLLRNLLGQQDSAFVLKDEAVLAAKDLAPSDTANLDKNKVLAIVTDMGSYTSHAVIMARSLEVPAVVGLHSITRNVKSGDIVLVDGYGGLVHVNPTEETLRRYGKIKDERQRRKAFYRESAKAPLITQDGHPVTLKANIGGLFDVDKAREYGSKGVGLYRTESLFLKEIGFPSEEEQYESYSRLVKKMAPEPVIIRTLDVGGDKQTLNPLFPQDEVNPFMGLRAIRFCLEEPEMFKIQLRAILRASVHGEAQVMYPMIACVEELIEANALLEAAKEELREEGVAFNEVIKVGSMIEIPSAAYSVDLLAEHCDFFSIGTNDLIQYMLAVDRTNDLVAKLYRPNHPALIRTFSLIIKEARKKDVPVGVCGELAGDPLYAPLLLGFGASDLSVTPSAMPELKYVIRAMNMADARELGEKVLKCDHPQAISTLLTEFYEKLTDPLKEILNSDQS